MNIRTVVTATLVAVAGAGPSSASVVELLQPQHGQAMYTFSGSYDGYAESHLSFYCLNCKTPKNGASSISDCTQWPVKSFHVSSVTTNGDVTYWGYNGNRQMDMRIRSYDRNEPRVEYQGYMLCENPNGQTSSLYPYHTAMTMINQSNGAFGPVTMGGAQSLVIQPLNLMYVAGTTTEWAQTGGSLTMQVEDKLTLKKGESKSVIRHTHGEGHATLYVDTTGVPGLQCQIDGSAATGGLDLGPGDSLVCRNESGRLGVTEGTLNVIAAIR